MNRLSPAGCPPFARGIHRFTLEFTRLWQRSSPLLPDFPEQFSSAMQREQERRLDLLMARLPPRGDADTVVDPVVRKAVRAELERTMMAKYSRAAVSFAEGFFDSCERATDAFVGDARKFDPGLPDDDILQALRNLWVFNSIQAYLGLPVSMTRSAFAYSLLYPYTDNRLDGGNHDHDEVGTFVAWVARRLRGMPDAARAGQRGRIGSLVGMIEEEYPRTEWTEVHQSLLAIHRAQVRSHRLGHGAPDADLALLTVEKGGTSVLADGYLAAGRLRPGEACAFFAYGVMLQLIDDLQDVAEDLSAGRSSLFARCAERGFLDDSANVLVNFVRSCTSVMARHVRPQARALCDVIGRSCLTLIQDSVSCHPQFYTEEYLRNMERFSPVRFAYLRSFRECGPAHNRRRAVA